MMRMLGMMLCLAMAAVAARAQEPVKVGVIVPLTGALAFDGSTAVKGAQLAQKLFRPELTFALG